MSLDTETHPSSGQIYKSVQHFVPILGEYLANKVLENIVNHLDFEDSIAFNSFYKYAGFGGNDDMAYVFKSDHYRHLIYKEAVKLLASEGYIIHFKDDFSSRYPHIRYSGHVMHPLKKIARLIQPVYPMAFGYTFYLIYTTFNTYMQSRKQVNQYNL